MAKESLAKMCSRMRLIISTLKIEYPDARCSLDYDSPFQLLLATILSAQCTDARVNKVTKKLFKKYKTPKDFYDLPLEEIKSNIYSTGFYNNKAKAIKGMATAIIERHNGKFPQTLEEMVNLPSLVVDTHVTRISNLLRFVKTKNAVKIEKELCQIVNKSDWTIFAHLLIDHGRAVCIANRPQCNICNISVYCPSNKGVSK